MSITHESIEAMWERLVEDPKLTLTEVAKEYGVTHAAISERLRKLGRSVRAIRRELLDEEAKKMMELRSMGWSQLLIADYMKCSKTKVEVVLRKQGTKKKKKKKERKYVETPSNPNSHRCSTPRYYTKAQIEEYLATHDLEKLIEEARYHDVI